MKNKFKEINFLNKRSEKIQFDMVLYQDVLKKKPKDHCQFEYHKVSFYAILLFTGNTGKHNINFNEYDFTKGTLFTIRKDNIHKFYQNDGEGLLLVFTEDFIINHTNQLASSKMFLLFNEMLAAPKIQLNEVEYEKLMHLIGLMKKEYDDTKDEHTLSLIRNYIQIIITTLFRIKSNENVEFNYSKHMAMFLQFQKLIEEKSFQYKQVSFYAKQLGVSQKTLNNITQRIVNKSAKTFINEIVIMLSKRLIINSPNTLTEIAYTVGFEDPTNFFKYFKKYAGVTPKQFRITYRPE